MRDVAAFSFRFADQSFVALPERALWWAEQRTLLVADLHLEKASWYARSGQFLPPYDSDSTLARLVALATMLAPHRIICLGDSFHDAQGIDRLSDASRTQLVALGERYEMIWVAGNHDGLIGETWGGHVRDECVVAGVALRHQAFPHDRAPEISGHFHPKLQTRARGRSVSRPCFVVGEHRLILPAFGSLTGGLSVHDPAIAGLFDTPFAALVATSGALHRFSVPGLAATAG